MSKKDLDDFNEDYTSSRGMHIAKNFFLPFKVQKCQDNRKSNFSEMFI